MTKKPKARPKSTRGSRMAREIRERCNGFTKGQRAASLKRAKAIMKRSGPRWTSDKPTAPGYYWWRNGSATYVLMVQKDSFRFWCHFTFPNQVIPLDDLSYGQWSGPIQEPAA